LDDASTDESVEIIERQAAKYPFIRLLRNADNHGVIAAHHRLFEEARGDYVYAGAADDGRFPKMFESAMRMAEQYPHAGLICGEMPVVDENEENLATLNIPGWNEPRYAPPDVFLNEYLERVSPSHSLCGATVYRREAIQEVGWYRPELGSWSDTWAARAIGLKYGICYVPEPFVLWRKLSTSYSGQSRTNSRHTLDLITRAARLMRSQEFRDRFPEHHVRRWERRYRQLTMWNHWQGEGTGFRPLSPSFWIRSILRLPKLPSALTLAFYRPEEPGAPLL
jgi:glycosyltransferase involved in cell wall biosynthesis